MSLVGYHRGVLVWDDRGLTNNLGTEYSNPIEKVRVDPSNRFAFGAVGKGPEQLNHPFIYQAVERLLVKLTSSVPVDAPEIEKLAEYIFKLVGDTFIAITKCGAWYGNADKMFVAGDFPIAIGTGRDGFIAACLLGEEVFKAGQFAGYYDSRTSAKISGCMRADLKPFAGDPKPVVKKKAAPVKRTKSVVPVKAVKRRTK